MLDSFNREISYLRISVTDRCNLRCLYCMPEEGVPLRDHSDCLSFEEIARIAREASSLGIRKVRLTGGEPLVRKGITDLVGMLRQIQGIELITMTTNGYSLDNYAQLLKEAGLDSVNISLDTLDSEKYSYLTRGGNIANVLNGIDAAAKVGFPIKLNMVVTEETEAAEVDRMREFCRSRGVRLQQIREYSLKEDKEEHDDITYHRPPPCSECNRIRLLSNGRIKPCLHSDHEIVIDKEDIRSSLMEAIQNKPRCGTVCSTRNMVEIGG